MPRNRSPTRKPWQHGTELPRARWVRDRRYSIQRRSRYGPFDNDRARLDHLSRLRRNGVRVGRKPRRLLEYSIPGLSRNTLVLYLGDNGSSWASTVSLKRDAFEQSSRAMLAYAPG